MYPLDICNIVTILLCLTNFQSRAEIDKIVIETDWRTFEVSEKFLSLAIDTKFIFRNDLSDLMTSKAFMNLARGLQPAYLRIGGTAADLVIFDNTTQEIENVSSYKNIDSMEYLSWRIDTPNTICTKHRWPVLHLGIPKWLSINTLAKSANFNLIYDLNVLNRQSSGKWDPSNALRLIEFSQEHNLSIDWQLGNEPNSFCHVFGKKVPPQQLASDFNTLSLILSKYPLYQKSKLLGPDITAPRGPKKRQLATLRYLDKFMSTVKNNINAATWHQYYVNGRNATKEELMDTSIMENLRREIRDVKAIVSKHTGEFFPVWITETASAFGGGAANLSDRFVSGFLWLDKLGMSAAYNISVVVRQSLIGGHYGLISEKFMQPTACYWISYVHKKLVGRNVLSLKTTLRTPAVRLYAHCFMKSRPGRNSIVIFGMNLGLSDYKGQLTINQNNSSVFKIKKYLLTGVDNDVCSRHIQLNGKILKLSSSGELPVLMPMQLKSKSIDLPPKSIGFFVIRGLSAPACE